ncbi:MAG: isoprenylcysteine carboxylmethyltransferase family protein [Acidobacteriaceae bacterium]
MKRGERASVSGRTGWQRIARRIRVPMGFVFAALYLWLARPSWRAMAASAALVLPGLWLRGYASGYVRKDAELTTTGPYAHTRNPLYLGSMLIAFGFAAAAASWVILALLAMLFAAIYIPTILSEEAYLREHFADYEAYARAVPRLLPRGAGAGRELAADGAVAATGGFSAELYRHHREYNSAMGAAAIYLALALKLLYFSR